MPLTILELLLKIVLLAMEGQTPAQRAKMWDWYIADLSFWRALLKIDPSPLPAQLQSFVETFNGPLPRFKIDPSPAPAQAVARAPRRRTR